MFELRNPRQRAAQLEAAILLHLRHHPHETADELQSELAGECGVTRATLHNLLEDMVREGSLRRLRLHHGDAYCVRRRPFFYPFSHWLVPLG